MPNPSKELGNGCEIGTDLVGPNLPGGVVWEVRPFVGFYTPLEGPHRLREEQLPLGRVGGSHCQVPVDSACVPQSIGQGHLGNGPGPVSLNVLFVGLNRVQAGAKGTLRITSVEKSPTQFPLDRRDLPDPAQVGRVLFPHGQPDGQSLLE